MAIDVYLQIDGIKGESTDSTHEGWIELTSAQWGVTQPKSATASTGGGHTAERCEFTEHFGNQTFRLDFADPDANLRSR